MLSMGIVGIVLQKEEAGTRKQVSSFTPGMSFGELSFIQGTVRTADVVAVTDVETYTFTREALETFRKIHPEGFQTILKNAIVALSDRLVRANREVAALK